jgi:transposase InsO family protein
MGLMNEVKATASVSVGCCYDNASEESFNSILKTEGLYNWFGKTKFKDRRVREGDVLQEVAEFIHRYNHKRRKKQFNWETSRALREKSKRYFTHCL